MRLKGIQDAGLKRIAQVVYKQSWADDDDMRDLSENQAKANALEMLQAGNVDGIINHIEKHDEYVNRGYSSNRNYLGIEDFANLCIGLKLWEIAPAAFSYILSKLDEDFAQDLLYNVGSNLYDYPQEFVGQFTWQEYYSALGGRQAAEDELIKLKEYIDANPEIAAEQGMEAALQEGLLRCPELKKAIDEGERLDWTEW